MHIKVINMWGFRSYPGRTEITCVPGLQVFAGSGSNDLFTALRYVLGEKRLSVLGCRRLDELIYDGDDQRQADHYNEVNLVVDNADSKLPVDYRAIHLRRRYFRSKESEFQVNSSSCRLKDISELLQDILHVEGATVWGASERQGFVRLNPDERRRLWDLTIGCKRHHDRMDRAHARLLKTEESLERINKLLLNGIHDQTDRRETERVDFLKSQKGDLSNSVEKLQQEIELCREKLSSQFESSFPLLCHAFAFEALCWTGRKVKLICTLPGDPSASGIAIEGLVSLTEKERYSLGWAFWAACMKVTSVPVAVLQIDPEMDESDRELLGTVLKELAPYMQLLVCNESEWMSS